MYSIHFNNKLLWFKLNFIVFNFIKEDLVNIFVKTLPSFIHTEKGKFLDGKM